MPARYFENLPNLIYGNTYCKDITKRVVAANTKTNTPYLFHPYELQDDLRSDLVSEFYYRDSDYDWVIYHSNQIIDPYYQWYLNDNNFNNYIIEKYQSIERSQKLIKYYINNWSSDDRELSTSFYDTNLDGQYKKYWRPNFGPAGQIVSWRRREDNTTMNTNRILQYTISANNGTAAFEIGELVDVKSGEETVATGEVCISNTTTVTIKSVAGNTFANSTTSRLVVGETTGANITANDVSTVYENITEEEQVYWEPVYFYDYEQMCNESKKHLIIADVDILQNLVETFVEKVNEDTDFVTRLPRE